MRSSGSAWQLENPLVFGNTDKSLSWFMIFSAIKGPSGFTHRSIFGDNASAPQVVRHPYSFKVALDGFGTGGVLERDQNVRALNLLGINKGNQG